MTRMLAAGLITAGSLLVGSTGVIAAPASGIVINEAASEVGLAEAVHCRRFVHRHVWGRHRCGSAVVITEGVRVRSRAGVVRSRTGVDVDVRTRDRVRSGTTIRSREGTTIRSGTGSEGTIRSGTGSEGTVRGRTGTEGQTGGTPSRQLDRGGASGTTGGSTGPGGGAGGGGGAGAGGGGGAGGGAR